MWAFDLEMDGDQLLKICGIIDQSRFVITD